MITHPAYTVEPWCLRETDLDLEVIAESESLFALSNGHAGWRGTGEGERQGGRWSAMCSVCMYPTL